MSSLTFTEDPFRREIVNWRYALDDGLSIAGLYRKGAAANAPRVHFLHGNGFCASTLLELSAHLPSDGHYWFTDVPGHGFSDQPHHRMPNWPAMAADVAESLEYSANVAQEGPVIGIGHSMGGVLTLLAAAKKPDLFSRIILLDPVLFAPEILWAQSLLQTTGLWKRGALIKAVQNRRDSWDSSTAAAAYLAGKRLYRNWPLRVLEILLRAEHMP